MKIPTGNFGFAVPQVQRTGTVGSMENAGAAGAAMASVGQAGMRIAGQMMEEQDIEHRRLEAEQKKKQEALEKTRAVKAEVDFKDVAATTFDETVAALGRGEISRDDAAKRFNDALGKARTDLLSGLSPDVQPHVSVLFDSTQNHFNRNLFGALDENRRSEIAANAEYIRDSMAKQAGRPGADIAKINAEGAQALRVLYRDAGFKPEVIEKKVQGFSDENTFNGMVATINTVNRDPGKLRTMRAELEKNGRFQGQELDPKNANAILSTLNNRIQALDHEAQAAENRRLSQAEHAYNAAEKAVSSGLTLSLEDKTALIQRTKGTPYASAVEATFKAESEIQDVLRKPMSEQVAYLRQREAAVKQGGSLADQASLARVRKAVGENIKQLETAPLVQAVERDGAKLAPLSLEQIMSPSAQKTVFGELSNRLAELDRMEKTYGAPRKPLFPEEANFLQGALRDGTTEMRGKILDTLRKGLNDDRAYRAAVQQIAPDSPVTAVAGVIRGKSRDAVIAPGVMGMGRQTINGKETSDLILEGETILNRSKGQKGEDGKTKGFPMPPDKEFNSTFAASVGSAFASDESGYERAYQAARAWYAGKSIREGDYTGNLNSTRLSHAINAVTGGVDNFNGRGSVLLPWGMDGSQFKDAVRKDLSRAVKDSGLPASVVDMFPHYGLIQKGDGRYFVTNGTQPIIGPNGKPLEVRVQTEFQSFVHQIPK